MGRWLTGAELIAAAESFGLTADEVADELDVPVGLLAAPEFRALRSEVGWELDWDEPGPPAWFLVLLLAAVVVGVAAGGWLGWQVWQLIPQ